VLQHVELCTVFVAQIGDALEITVSSYHQSPCAVHFLGRKKKFYFFWDDDASKSSMDPGLGAGAIPGIKSLVRALEDDTLEIPSKLYCRSVLQYSDNFV
jgi:hypothetical protein